MTIVDDTTIDPVTIPPIETVAPGPDGADALRAMDDLRHPDRPGAISRAFKDRRLKHYNRLVALVAVANLWSAYRMLGGHPVAGLSPSDLMVVNLTVAIVIRQQYVINGLFKLATSAPTSWPLRVRWTLGKVYHFGGIHTSAATAATVWFLIALARSLALAVGGTGAERAAIGPLWVIGLNVMLGGLLIAIVFTALPFVRQKKHDRFERVHRLGGWAALALFWVTTLATGPAVSWTVAALALSTVSVALPWLRLKRVPVQVHTPSDHVALARFDHGYTPFAGSSTAISHNPLLEWHSFANVPIPGEDGFLLTISRAGDWTGEFIDGKPDHVWVKGICTAGVANIEVLFNRVLYVATGSGIGPCLPHLLAAKVPAHLVWATRNPETTYGQPLVDEILAVQPDAVIWDTDARGKPDMVELAHRRALEVGAEAVICISNPKLTWAVVEGLEKRGMPAYGAIWDS